MRPLRSQLPGWPFPFRYANMHLGLKSKEYSKWNDGTNGGLPATRIYRACMTSPLDWLLMVAVAAVKSDYWRRDPGDWFACGIGGAFDDQVVNASIQWQNLENTGDLRLSELELQQVDLVHDALFKYCALMSELEQGQPLPKPSPPPPPKPPEPVKPPTAPAVPPPPPTAPAVPKPPVDWKKPVLGILTLAATIAALTPIPWDDIAVKVIKFVLNFF